MSRFSFLCVAGVIVAASGCAGCGNEQSPEELRADSALTRGKTAILRDDYHTAKEQVLAALALDGGLNRRPRVAEETRLLGDMAAAGASFDSAFFWYGVSLGDFRGLAARSGARDVTLRVAALRRRMGEERKAFTMYVEARRLARVRGDPEDDDRVKAFFEALGELREREGDRLFWVMGVDMAHMGARYHDGFAAVAGEGKMQEVGARDEQRIERINALDAGGFWDLVRERRDDLKWCGSAPFYTFLKTAPKARGELLKYEQWNIDDHSVVSFAGMGFRKG